MHCRSAAVPYVSEMGSWWHCVLQAEAYLHKVRLQVSLNPGKESKRNHWVFSSEDMVPPIQQDSLLDKRHTKSISDTDESATPWPHAGSEVLRKTLETRPSVDMDLQILTYHMAICMYTSMYTVN